MFSALQEQFSPLWLTQLNAMLSVPRPRISITNAPAVVLVLSAWNRRMPHMFSLRLHSHMTSCRQISWTCSANCKWQTDKCLEQTCRSNTIIWSFLAHSKCLCPIYVIWVRPMWSGFDSWWWIWRMAMQVMFGISRTSCLPPALLSDPNLLLPLLAVACCSVVWPD